MSKKNDYTHDVIHYFRTVLQEDVVLRPANKGLIHRLPISITLIYDLYEGELLGQNVVFVFSTTGTLVQTPMQTQKVLAVIQSKSMMPVILVLREVMAYQVNRLISQRINIVVPHQQMFIPSLLIDVSKRKMQNADLTQEIPALAQCVLLYHLQVEVLNGKSAKEIAAIFCVSYATANRGMRWLKEHQLVTFEEGKTKRLRFTDEGKALWETALPLLSSPIERILFMDNIVEIGLEAGVNALSTYTMLNRTSSQCYALSKEETQAAGIDRNSIGGEHRIEVWRYSPRLLSRGHTIDRLSLYLSLRDSEDERIQIELERLIRETPW